MEIYNELLINGRPICTFEYLVYELLDLFNESENKVFNRRLSERSKYTWGHLFEDPNPEEDVEEVARYLPPKTVAAIAATDFTKDAVVVLLRGVEGYGNDTFIERIGSRYGSLTAYAQFWVPVQGYAYPEVMTFPFHVVKIRRAGLPTIGGSTPSLAIRYEAYEVTPTPPAVLPSN